MNALPGFDVAAAAASIAGTLRDHSAACEARRRAAPESVSAMREAGLARLLTPKAFGGLELPPSAQIDACLATGQSCSAASWVNMVCAAHTFVVARYSQACREEVFGTDPDVLIPGTLAPQGTARPVDGGVILNGRWQFGSGINHGPWVLLGAAGVKTEDGKRTPPVHVVAPKSDIQVLDTWYTLGMRGSGSNDLAAEELFVPAHRVMPTMPLFDGTFEGEAEPLYRLPVMGTLASMLAGTVVGFTEAGLQTFIGATKVRKEVYAGSSKAAKAGVQMRVAEALSEVAAARHFIEQNGRALDTALASGHPVMDTAEKVELRWNAAYAVELCRRASERVFAVAGAHAIYDDHALQRFHRDINTASHHAIADIDAVAEMKGKLELGLGDQLGFV
ncbi:MAG: hypothetical protein ACMVY4_01500 [Minwuia sp.]|uniref:hypothetical protein n=1 Tax=Minwuia sp. TaxID=2493630 RepID=UPI003A8C3A7A